MNALNLTISLDSERLVYPNDILVGLRQLELKQGVSYALTFTYIQNGNTVSPTISDFGYTLKNDSVILQSSNYSNGVLNLTIANPTLDYILGISDFVLLESFISFSIGGVSYNISCPTKIDNAFIVSPALEYYPLSGNPSSFLTINQVPTPNLSAYATTTALNSAISVLQASISATQFEPSNLIFTDSVTNTKYTLVIVNGVLEKKEV